MSLSNDEMTLADEQAALWLFQRNVGLSPDDERRFAEWRAASDDNAAAWARAEAAWGEIDSEDDPLLDAMRADALSARPTRRIGMSDIAMRVAAVLVVGVLGVAGWRVISATRPVSGTAEIAMTATPTYGAQADRRTIALPDGSQAVLDRGTALALAYTAHRRDLRLLRGRALFDVRHDGRPFAVEADDVTVTATGTRFAVEVQPQGMSATLERGQVVVSRRGDPSELTLTPGQLVLAVTGRPMSLSKVDPSIVLAWSEGYVEFHDTPLGLAVEQINRNGLMHIHVLGEAAKLKVSGRFPIGDARGFVSAVVEILPVRQRSSRDGGIDLVLKPRD